MFFSVGKPAIRPCKVRHERVSFHRVVGLLEYSAHHQGEANPCGRVRFGNLDPNFTRQDVASGEFQTELFVQRLSHVKKGRKEGRKEGKKENFDYAFRQSFFFLKKIVAIFKVKILFFLTSFHLFLLSRLFLANPRFH